MSNNTEIIDEPAADLPESDLVFWGDGLPDGGLLGDLADAGEFDGEGNGNGD